MSAFCPDLISRLVSKRRCSAHTMLHLLLLVLTMSTQRRFPLTGPSFRTGQILSAAEKGRKHDEFSSTIKAIFAQKSISKWQGAKMFETPGIEAAFCYKACFAKIVKLLTKTTSQPSQCFPEASRLYPGMLHLHR